MGCANSRERRCRHCHAPLSPVRRSISFDVRGRLRPSNVDDTTCHLVSLKSSTLGSLPHHLTSQQEEPDVVDRDPFLPAMEMEPVSEEEEKKGKGDMLNEFSMGLIEAKTWSNMIDEKIAKVVVPRTPLRTPPGEPEMINAWELMEGLDDNITPFRSPNHSRSFSFDFVRNPALPQCDLLRSSFRENGPPGSPEVVGSGGIAMAFDPKIIASFRKSLQELSPDHLFHVHSSNSQEDASVESDNREPAETLETDEKPESCPKEKVVVYFTSLRGVRKTYEDCCYVRVILKGMGLRIDERDVSMHSGFKDELAELLGDGACRGRLPRVFAGKKYIGGAEEVRRMHEEGVLEEVMKGCQRADEGETCETCGDIRFVPCETCSGSCKVYYDQEEEEEECEEGEGEGEGVIGFKRCPDCNENGLIRCPICCY